MDAMSCERSSRACGGTVGPIHIDLGRVNLRDLGMTVSSDLSTKKWIRIRNEPDRE